MSEIEPVSPAPAVDSTPGIAPSPDPNPPTGRDATGRFTPGNEVGSRFPPGNLAAVQHGLRAALLPPEFAYLAAELAEFLEAALVDEGEPDVPRRRRGLLEYRARVHRRILQLDTAIELRGLFDKRGKLRVAWLQRLEGLIHTAKALDSLLGLSRRARHIPSLADVAREYAPAGDLPIEPGGRTEATRAPAPQTSALAPGHELARKEPGP